MEKNNEEKFTSVIIREDFQKNFLNANPGIDSEALNNMQDSFQTLEDDEDFKRLNASFIDIEKAIVNTREEVVSANNIESEVRKRRAVPKSGGERVSTQEERL